jgi:serine/threonine-protein kinase HipA
MEDFYALLGLRPAAKYETTWERIARAVGITYPAPAITKPYAPDGNPVADLCFAEC